MKCQVPTPVAPPRVTVTHEGLQPSQGAGNERMCPHQRGSQGSPDLLQSSLKYNSYRQFSTTSLDDLEYHSYRSSVCDRHPLPLTTGRTEFVVAQGML